MTKKQTKPKPIQGWECPKCGAVWSYFVRGCGICNVYANIRAKQLNETWSNN